MRHLGLAEPPDSETLRDRLELVRGIVELLLNTFVDSTFPAGAEPPAG